MSGNIKDHINALFGVVEGEPVGSGGGGTPFPIMDLQTAYNFGNTIETTPDRILYLSAIGSAINISAGSAGLNLKGGTAATGIDINAEGSAGVFIGAGTSAGGVQISGEGSTGGVSLNGGSGPITIHGDAGGVVLYGDGGAITLQGGGGLVAISGGSLGVQMNSGSGFDINVQGPSDVSVGAPTSISIGAPTSISIGAPLYYNLTSSVVAFTGGAITNPALEIRSAGTTDAPTIYAAKLQTDSLDRRESSNRYLATINPSGTGTAFNDFEINVGGFADSPAPGSSYNSARFVMVDPTSARRASGRIEVKAGGTVAAGPVLEFFANNKATNSGTANGNVSVGISGQVDAGTLAPNSVATVYVQSRNFSGLSDGRSFLRFYANNRAGLAGALNAPAASTVLGLLSDGLITIDATPHVDGALDLVSRKLTRVRSTAGDVELADVRGSAYLTNSGNPALLTTDKTIFGSINEAFTITGLKSPANPGICTSTPIPSSAISINYTTRILTITPPAGSFDFFTEWSGVPTKRTKAGPVNFPAFTDTDGEWFFYFDSLGDAVTTQTPWAEFATVAPVYRILWNSSLSPDSAKSVGEAFEAHLNDITAADHSWQHRYGTIWYSGLDLIHNAIASGTPNASGLNTCFSLTSGSCHDDNLPYPIINGTAANQWTQDLGNTAPASITVSNGGQFPVRYQDSVGRVSNLATTRFPFAFSAGNLIEFITPAGVRTVPTTGNFVVYFLYSFQDPRTGKQVKSVSSGAQYSNLTNALAVTWTDIQAAYPTLRDSEIRPIARLIYEYRSAYDVAIKKAALRNVADIRSSSVTVISTAAGSVPASSVTYTPTDPATATNVQSALDHLSGVEYISCVADTPNPLTAASADRQIIEVGAANSPIVLPDATTLARGRRFEILNSGTEIAVVQNFGTASSVLLWIRPGEALFATLTDKTTDEGIWGAIKLADEDQYETYDNDFVGLANDIQPAGVRPVFSGVGSGVTAYGSGQVYFGVTRQTTGTDATGYALIKCLGYQASIGTALFNAGKAVIMRFITLVNSLSDGTNTYTVRAGATDADTGAEPANGVYFRTDGDGDIWGVCRAAGVETLSPLSGGKITTYGSAMTDKRAVVSSNGLRVDFWAGKTYLGKVEENIPKTAVLNINVGITKTAGTTSRNLYVDRLTISRGK